MDYNDVVSVNYDTSDFLSHHGVKGQKWGVRRYQYRDGSLTPLGRSRIEYGKRSGAQKIATGIVMKYYETQVNRIDTRRAQLGNSKVDTYLKNNTPLYRIQSNDQFENHAFFATYKEHDKDQYAGLFGKNLRGRAQYEAKVAEREAQKTGDYSDAEAKRKKADEMKIYQLSLSNTSKLKIPSEENAGQIVGKLLKDEEFKKDLIGSIDDTASKMRRPSQRLLLSKAKEKLESGDELGRKDHQTIYRALNLTLTNHNDQEVAMQNKFYKAMKDSGYSALLDLNDSKYSSYHAQSPVIVFDTSKVSLKSSRQLEETKIEELYKKYNAERIKKESLEQTIGTLSKYAGMGMDEIVNSAGKRVDRYMRGKSK